MLSKYYPGSYFGYDREGAPVFIDPVGEIDFRGQLKYGMTYKSKETVFLLRYHPPSSTLPALIGASAFAFNKYPHKPYIF